MAKALPENAAPLSDLAALRAALAGAAVSVVPVSVPQLGGVVHVRAMTTPEILSGSAAGEVPAEASAEQRSAWNVARWVCDASGARLVKPDDLETLALFATLPWDVSRQILDAAGVLDGADAKNG